MVKVLVNNEYRDANADELARFETDKANGNAERETLRADKEAKDNLKASAKAKLIAGEPLTEEEADTIVL
jgi:hypothetical protein